MLKSLYPHVEWDAVRIVGCDMDGTLYDEAEFIAQVYRPIADILARVRRAEPARLHAWLFQRWLEKGSSYRHIFSEAVANADIARDDADKAVARCVEVFRSHEPTLTLTPRVQAILDAMCTAYPMFLISDGSAALQKRKFESLGLARWFEEADVGISGCHGPEFNKPDTRILGRIKVLEAAHLPRQVMFFGDREVDAQFASNAGFQFVRVACMHPVILG